MDLGNSGDIVLLNLIRDGDESAFRYLFDREFTAVSRYIATYIDDFSEAEQLALDIFAQVWENRKTLRINLTLRAYLMTAARNRSLNYIRDNSRKSRLDDHRITKIHEDHSVEFNELHNLIGEAIWSLPPKCGEVFRLSREKNLSNQEISELTGISVKTIEAHITKALRLIKEYLGDSYHFLW